MMRKIFLFLAAISLFLFPSASITNAAWGEDCKKIGGECRTYCLSGEEDIGAIDCFPAGQAPKTCCRPEDIPKKSCGESCIDSDECPPECPACQEEVQGQGKVCRVAGPIEPAPPVPVVSCIPTAIGCIDISGPGQFVDTVLKLAIGLAGGIAMLLIIFGGIQILTSAGNPEKISAGKELITSAITGLILIVFSVFILRIIGVEVLEIFE